MPKSTLRAQPGTSAARRSVRLEAGLDRGKLVQARQLDALLRAAREGAGEDALVRGDAEEDRACAAVLVEEQLRRARKARRPAHVDLEMQAALEVLMASDQTRVEHGVEQLSCQARTVGREVHREARGRPEAANELRGAWDHRGLASPGVDVGLTGSSRWRRISSASCPPSTDARCWRPVASRAGRARRRRARLPYRASPTSRRSASARASLARARARRRCTAGPTTRTVSSGRARAVPRTATPVQVVSFALAKLTCGTTRAFRGEARPPFG